MKINREFKYLIYSLAPGNTEIVIEDAVPRDPSRSNESLYEEFLQKLPPDDCRYAIFDFEHEKSDGSGKRNRICFITWLVSSLNTRLIWSSDELSCYQVS